MTTRHCPFINLARTMRVLPLFLLLIGSQLATAQVDSVQQLTMYKTFGGAHFEYQKDTAIFSVSPKQVLLILKEDPLAYAEFKKAKENNSIAGILGFIGGIFVIVPVVATIAGDDPEWGLVAGGTALIVASIPFSKAYKRHASNAIDIYNKKHTAFRPKTELHLSGLGAKLIIKL
jgi:hypothetical protein